jgi:D-aspartate ligase
MPRAPRGVTAKRPVLMIDGGSRGDIGVIRSLGMGGVPVHLLAADPHSPSAVSRYVTHVHPFPGFEASDEACLTAIQWAARESGTRPIMFATGDRALRLMSRHRAELAEFVDHDLAPAETINSYLDKDLFAPVARTLDLPVPETFVPANATEARALAGRLPYPVFAKPVHRADWDRLPPNTVASAKGQRIDSHAEMLRLLDAIDTLGPSRFIIQGFVEGGDHEHVSVHAYVLPDGTVTGTFIGSKLRIWPPYAGVGTLVVSLRIPELEVLSRQVIRRLGYTGFLDLQFKRDSRLGVYKLLEINCRYSVWTELPSRAGCNFPLAAYATLVGRPLPHIEQRERMAWLDLERDMLGMMTYRASGEWGWGGWLRSLANVRCCAYFAWDDLRPFFRKLRERD